MNALWIAGSLLALAATCPAQQNAGARHWQKLAGAREPTGGTVVQIDGRSALKVSNTNDAPLSVQLLRISAPPITKRLYALVGEVSMRASKATATWNCGTSFRLSSRTCPEAGILAGHWETRARWAS